MAQVFYLPQKHVFAESLAEIWGYISLTWRCPGQRMSKYSTSCPCWGNAKYCAVLDRGMSNYALSLTRECQTLSCSGQRNVKFRDILDKGMSNSPLSCTMDDQIPCYSWQWILKIRPLLDKRFSIPSYPRKLIFKFRLNSTEGGCQTPRYPQNGIVKLRAILTVGLSNSALSSPWDCQTQF